MAIKTLETNDLAMHAHTLGAMIGGFSLYGITSGRDIVYILDGRGNQINFARLEEETLTDGSKVYNLHLSAE